MRSEGSKQLARVAARSRRLGVIISLLLLLGGVAAAQGANQPAAGTWEGAIEIPGSPLAVVVTLSADDGWSGTIDIPAQGAIGVPLEAIAADGAEVSFRISGVPGEPTFTGAVDGDAMAGTFAQAGQEFPFTLARSDQAAGSADAAAAAGQYQDPAGRFDFPVPAGWVVSEHDGFVRVAGPEGDIHLDVVVAPNSDGESAIADAWALTAPDLELEIIQTIEPPSEPGVDSTVVVNYQTEDRDRILQALGQVVGDETYVMLIDGQLAAVQRRTAQLQIVATGLNISGVEEVDLAALTPLEFAAVEEEFDEFVAEMLAEFELPGASVAIVQGGEVVHLAGYGVKEAGGNESITPQTQMMTGSIGKTLTSLLVATLVDDGVIDWDTPVIEVLPRFAVADEQLTETLTIRNLLCACTGVPRRDYELAFNYDELSAERIVESLREFEFFTDFGEAFQYSNQLVATAGYAAAAAAGAPYGELQPGYRQALAERVTGPIGMSSTTLDLGAVEARGDHAMPHQLSFETVSYELIDLGQEGLLNPVEPAGSHWSTAEDMARYMLTELALGVAPDGERVVSEDNLLVTWEPQVAVSATDSYGLGWFVGEYRGLPLLYHAGNTLGFSADMMLAPTAELGITVFANAQAANVFTNLVYMRLMELLYEQPNESLAQATFALEQTEQALEETKGRVLDRMPLSDALTYFGTYTNPALGEVVLRIADGQLLLDAGEWAIEVRPYLDRAGEPDGYFTIGAPLSGLTLNFETADDGATQMVLGEGLVSYTFTRLR